MKTILILEPPFSSLSLEFEEMAAKAKYTYFSLSDALLAELGGDSEISKKMEDLKQNQDTNISDLAVELILKKYLQKPTKNNPNGFILDSDCFNSLEELKQLKETLNSFGYQIDTVVDVKLTPEECAEDIEDFQVERSEGLAEIADYFENLYPQSLEFLKSNEIEIIEISDEEDEKLLFAKFAQILKQEKPI